MYTKEKLTQEINTIIIDKLGVEPNEVIADATLFDLGADELDQVELVMNFEREFDVTIPYEIAETFVKISDIYSFFFIHFKVDTILIDMLKDSVGEEFYTSSHGIVVLHKISGNVISVRKPASNVNIVLNYDGSFHSDGECILFPSKENRDWNTYKPKVKFEIGEPCWVKVRSIFGWDLKFYTDSLKDDTVIKFDQIKFKGYNVDIKLSKII